MLSSCANLASLPSRTQVYSGSRVNLRLAVAAAIVLSLVTPLRSQKRANAGWGTVFVISSSDVKSELSADKLQECLHQLTREWKQDERMIPGVVVLVVSKRVAKAALVKGKLDIRHKHSPSGSESYDEIWLVDPTIENYMLGLQAVVEDRFQLKLTETQRREVLLRVTRKQTATIDVSEGK